MPDPTLDQFRRLRLFVAPRGICCAAIVLSSSVLVGGCAETTTSKAGPKGVAESRSTASARPRLAESAVEAFPDSGVGQLDFYDELETRDLVSYDDALHAVLLLTETGSGSTFVQRAATAKRAGIVDAAWRPQPRDAITVGEIGSMLGVLARRDGAVSRSFATFQAEGIIPQSWREQRGVSGPELLGILRRFAEKHVRRSDLEQAHVPTGELPHAPN